MSALDVLAYLALGVGVIIALVVVGGLLYLFFTEMPEVLVVVGGIGLIWAIIWAGDHLGFWVAG